MRYLQKLPNSRRSPPGLERRILSKLPTALLAGTVIPAACYGIAWLYPDPAIGDTPEKYLSNVGIAAVATVIGVIDWVVDAVAVRIIGGNALQIAEAVRRRRAEVSPDDVFVERGDTLLDPKHLAAEKVLRRATVPVLTVRYQHRPECEAGNCAWCASGSTAVQQQLSAEADG